ncbi:siderophore-interacting protein [uncultured Ferrimonas sp.]|uniref:siderophore-interacting protein n=1 Tax=uncultured Ferrimonas sp. TaxID=432640 RepID=UPI00262DA42A|nr:siderophore-interacting protein [uncultured Ferrimonas sp.]
MKKKPTPQQLTVIDSRQISPNVQRLVLQGDDQTELPQECAGGYIKLMFTDRGDTDLGGLAEGQRPTLRTYTIRRVPPQPHSMEVDFVRHTTTATDWGFAARWAMNAKLGDTISIAGIGSASPINLEADWFFMVADLTSLPALITQFERLPANATGYAVIQVPELADKQPLTVPENLQLIWISGAESLATTVRALPWLAGRAAVWSACEFEQMRALRHYFRNDQAVARERIYISSYWKQGVSEDGHKRLKRQDAEAAN